MAAAQVFIQFLIQDRDGASAFFISSQNGYFDIIKLFYKHSARDELLCKENGMV
jgi:hypothetical protein